jgi:hypothetical protein
MMSRDHLPLTIDIVFDRKGYEITFAMEEKNFLPASPVIFREEPRGDGDSGRDKDSEQDDKSLEHARNIRRMRRGGGRRWLPCRGRRGRG